MIIATTTLILMLVLATAIAPLLSFVALVAGFGRGAGRHLRFSVAAQISIGALAVSLLAVVAIAVIWSGISPTDRSVITGAISSRGFTWFSLGDLPIRVSILVDGLTIAMLLAIAIVGIAVQVFSIGYMHDEPRLGGYFAYLSLFAFAMFGLVLSANLLVTFVFWELVGICSYVLIGFWFTRPAAAAAATKAFIVNRVGDVGFLAAMGLCFSVGIGLSYGELSAAASKLDSVSLATWFGIALLAAAIGKSAQFPLHVWLPDAMEGPTPVSALIHAATMVAAGVYFLARVFVALTPDALAIIAAVGAATCLLGGLLACGQNDIKRILAYSTVSQLGLMVYAIGIGAWIAGVFLLLLHAFFKALLFLAAGQVISACHHEQDIRRMGGLAVNLPRTTIAFLIGVLAISGAGIPLTPLGIGGFYGKEEIFTVGLHRASGGFAVLYAMVLVNAYLTPFYMGRCFTLTFLGRPRDRDVFAFARESRVMYGPLIALGMMTFVSGWFVFRTLVAGAVPSGGLLSPTFNGNAPELHGTHHTASFQVGFAWVVGIGAAYLLYRGGPVRIANTLQLLFDRRLFIDGLYDIVFVRGVRALATICRLIDEWLIDGLLAILAVTVRGFASFINFVLDAAGVDGVVNGVGRTAWTLGGLLRAVQTGQLRHYLLLVILGMTTPLVASIDSRLAIAYVAFTVAVIAGSRLWRSEYHLPEGG